MTTIKTMQGRNIYEIDGERIKNYATGLTLYWLKNNNCGLSLYEWSLKRIYSYEDNLVRDYFGTILYRFDGHLFQDFNFRILYRYEGGYVQTFNYLKLYRFEGPVSDGEVALLLTAFEKGLLDFPR